ncbi:MAG: hypothetical protein AAFV85_09140 [Cyanobacteria bacterium J06634_6]
MAKFVAVTVADVEVSSVRVGEQEEQTVHKTTNSQTASREAAKRERGMK